MMIRQFYINYENKGVIAFNGEYCMLIRKKFRHIRIKELLRLNNKKVQYALYEMLMSGQVHEKYHVDVELMLEQLDNGRHDVEDFLQSKDAYLKRIIKEALNKVNA
jgi:hypothetical protein